jgi:hypothetical protein
MAVVIPAVAVMVAVIVLACPLVLTMLSLSVLQ